MLIMRKMKAFCKELFENAKKIGTGYNDIYWAGENVWGETGEAEKYVVAKKDFQTLQCAAMTRNK